MNSISTKLFLAFIGLTVLILSATLLLGNLSVDQSFSNYVDGRERQRLEGISSDLSKHYAANGNQWSDASVDAFDISFDDWRPSRSNNKNRPPPPPEHKNTPPPFNKNAFKLHPDNRPERPLHATRLLDINKKYIAGVKTFTDSQSLIEVAVEVDGSIVGYLETEAIVGVQHSLEEEFNQQQTKASIVIAIVSLLLACIASWWLVRVFLAPIIIMKNGVTFLANGNYAHRLPVNRKDEIGELMLDINKLSHILEENRNSRKLWLADISHELRTPVTILSGEIEAIRHGVRQFDEDQLSSFEHETNRLKHLIQDLYELSLSEVGGLRYEFKSMDFSDFLQTNLSIFKDRFYQQGFDIKSEITQGLMINGDVNRLQQLITNIVNNSFSYTDKPGQLVVKAEANSTHIFVTFEDSSPGVPQEQMEKIFEALFRHDDSRSRRTAGAGLGLTICRNIAKAHSATLSAEESSIGGLKIIIVFPKLNV